MKFGVNCPSGAHVPLRVRARTSTLDVIVPVDTYLMSSKLRGVRL